MEERNLSAIVEQLKNNYLQDLEKPVNIEIQPYTAFTLKDIKIFGTDVIQFIGENKMNVEVSVFQHVTNLSFKVTGYNKVTSNSHNF